MCMTHVKAGVLNSYNARERLVILACSAIASISDLYKLRAHRDGSL